MTLEQLTAYLLEVQGGVLLIDAILLEEIIKDCKYKTIIQKNEDGSLTIVNKSM